MNPPAVVLDVVIALMREQLSGFRGYPNTEAGELNFARRVQEVAVSPQHAAGIFGSFDVNFPTVREIRDTATSILPQFQPKVQPYEQWEREYGKPQKFDMAPDNRAMHWQAIRDALYYCEGPGRAELDAIANGPGDALQNRLRRNKEKLFWTEALQYDTRDWAEAVVDVRAEADTYGWPAMMERSIPWGTFEARPKNHDMWTALKRHFVKTLGVWPGWAKITWRQIYQAMPELGYPLNREQEKMIGR
jgi:hypothetical protein